MIETTIVPIVKNKSGHLSDSSIYRPIALATIVSKMFESVLLFNPIRSDLRAGGGIKKPTLIISITSNGAFIKLGILIIYIMILSNIQLEIGK